MPEQAVTLYTSSTRVIPLVIAIMFMKNRTDMLRAAAKSFEDAIQKKIARADKTLKNVEGAWIKDVAQGRIRTAHKTTSELKALQANKCEFRQSQLHELPILPSAVLLEPAPQIRRGPTGRATVGSAPKLFAAVAILYGMIDRRSSPIDAALRSLVTVRVSQINTCSFCVDLNSATLIKRGVSLEKVQALETWRQSNLFDRRKSKRPSTTRPWLPFGYGCALCVHVPVCQRMHSHRWFSSFNRSISVPQKSLRETTPQILPLPAFCAFQSL